MASLSNDTPPAVAFCVDDRFAVPLAAALHSLLNGSVSGLQPSVFIVGEVTERNRRRLRRVAAERIDLHFISVNQNTLDNLPISENISLAAYYRILLPDILPPDLKKVIYLDVDVVVNGDIYDLWSEEVEDFAVAAVRDTHVFSANRTTPTATGNGESHGSNPYFNSGIMLLNLDHWRQHDLTNQVINYTRQNQHSNLYCDQDGLNAVLGTSWKELNPRWNLQTSTFIPSGVSTSDKEAYLNSVRSKLSGLMSEAHIVHYTMGRKPWHPFCPHPLRYQFHRHFLSSNFFRTYAGYAWWYAKSIFHWSRTKLPKVYSRVYGRLLRS